VSEILILHSAFRILHSAFCISFFLDIVLFKMFKNKFIICAVFIKIELI
jgi:hypothetical protein